MFGTSSHVCRARVLFVGGLLAVSVPLGVARGETTIGTLAQGPNPAAGNAYFGQTFTAPAGEAGLSSLSLLLFRADGGVPNPTVRVYAFDPTSDPTFGQLVGAPLYSQGLDLPITTPPNTGQVFTVVPNLALTPGNTYAFILDANAPSGGNTGSFFFADNYYPGGTFIAFSADTGLPVKFATFDLSFSATFGAIPEPSTLGLIPLAALTLRRRR